MTPWLDDGDVRLYLGDNLDVLRQLPDRSVHMCATSPPFYGLRDYGTGLWEGGDPDCDHTPRAASRNERPAGGLTGGKATVDAATIQAGTCHCGARRVDQQIGLEDTPDLWVERLVAVFREVRRVLRDDGTLWVEIGDSYVSSPAGNKTPSGISQNAPSRREDWQHVNPTDKTQIPGVKQKDLLGQPWALAFALRADGWYLRSEIIWARPNPMPESVTDRPTKSHSTVFLLSKQPRYFMDMEAIREDEKPWNNGAMSAPKFDGYTSLDKRKEQRTVQYETIKGANARSVWTIPTQPTPFAHFATWPEALVRRMILAGTSERGCCPECGAPWVRDVERTPMEVVPSPKRAGWQATGDAFSRTQIGGTVKSAATSTTLGWSPSCHHDTQPVPCTVLDPFAGSATTNLVARNHGRHSIGIELNEDYLRIAAQRLQQLSLLGGAL